MKLILFIFTKKVITVSCICKSGVGFICSIGHFQSLIIFLFKNHWLFIG